jgi:eukaryotic-like serine/threonine-protein kinase
MTLASGTKLGPYEIVAPLGAGGMGEVYRAKDTRLGREVAIKVLPQHLSANPEVRARFEREAKTVSSLNHPHICTLFDVGREGEVDYLVMELVEGETLAQRLRRGPLPPAEVLKLGAQIADALDRAHRAGVIHRDLKPGNVMLAKSGAKLMDFGLARATGMTGPAGGSGITHAALTQSPTVAQPLTAEGTIVGTFQYMSPEQLEGKEADARSDLWALGCVLHEMATGRRAFEGQSQASLIAAIMHVAPPPVSQVAPLAPLALDRVVAACLAKDPADRIQSAHDVKLQLGWISEPAPASGVTSAPGLPAPKAKGSSPLARLALVALALALAVAAAAAGIAWQLARRSPVVVAQLPVPRDLELMTNWSSVAISPAGDRVVAGARHRTDPIRLWLWRLDDPTPVGLAGTDGTILPCWSPDGRSIAFSSQSAKALFRLPLSGGEPTRIAGLTDPRGLSWGSKNVIVYAPSPSGPLMKVSAAGGTPEPATALDASLGEASHRFPSFLPDGEHFLFTAMPRGPNGYRVCVGSLSSTASKVVLEAESGASWAPPGYLIFVQGGKVTAQRFDMAALRVTGERFALDEAPVIGDVDAEPVASASRDGRLVYLANRAPDARLEWLDRTGVPRGAVALQEGDWNVKSLSPDQKAALATRDRDLWQIDLERAVATRLLEGIDPTETAQWSPDGRRIVATSRESGHEVLRFINAGGSGPRDSVPSPPALFQEVASWAPDGRSMLVAALGLLDKGAKQGGSWDLWMVPLDGGAAQPYAATGAFERLASISPDGKWAACVSFSEGQLDLFIDSYPVPGHRVQVFAGEPLRPMPLAWGRLGRELFYNDSEGYLVSVPVAPEGDELHLGKPVRLFPLPGSIFRLVTRDGDRFLVSRADGNVAGPGVRLVLGWKGLLRR